MTSYGATSAKRQKQAEAARETAQQRAPAFDPSEFFQGVAKVEYQAECGMEDTLRYRYYSPGERIQGRSFEDWIRPAVSYRSVVRQMVEGGESGGAAWGEQESPEQAKRRLRATFELCTKLGVRFWSLADSDLTGAWGSSQQGPTGTTGQLEDSHEELLDLALDLQTRTGVRLLAFTVDFAAPLPRFCWGALTTSDAHVASYVGTRLKRGLDVAQRLGAENLIVRGDTQGLQLVISTDMAKEIRHFSYFLKMAADYKKRIGYRGQLLLEPNDTRAVGAAGAGGWRAGEQQSEGYSYTRDAFASQTLLRQYGLERFYKLNLRPNTDAIVSSLYGLLGSVSLSGPGQQDLREATAFMKSTMEQGGLQPGGLSLCLTPRRSSTEPKDLVTLYIATIDTFARALRVAVKMSSDGLFSKNLRQRYLSFNTGWGNRFASGEASLESCEEELRRAGQPAAASSHAEHWEALFHRYLAL